MERLAQNRKPEIYGMILETAVQRKQWGVARDILTSLDAEGIKALSWEGFEVTQQREKEIASFVASQCKATISLIRDSDLPPEDKAKCVIACLRWDSEPEAKEGENAKRQQEEVIGHCAGLAKDIRSAAVQIEYCEGVLALANSDGSKLIALGEIRDALKKRPQGQEWGVDNHIKILSLGIEAAAEASRMWCRCESVSSHEAQYYRLEKEIVGALETCWADGWENASVAVKEKMREQLNDLRTDTYFRRATDEALDKFMTQKAQQLGIDMSKNEPYFPECVVQDAKRRFAQCTS